MVVYKSSFFRYFKTKEKFITFKKYNSNRKSDYYILHLCTFKTPPKGAVMSEQGDADCALKMRNGVK